MNKIVLIEILKSQEMREILSNIGIIHLYLIGSYSRGENTQNSDLDLVYELRQDVRIGGLEFIKNKMLIEKKLNLKVDLVNNNYIYKDIQPYIEKDKILIF